MASVYCELTWIRHLLSVFKIDYLKVTLLHCDNKVAICIATNRVFHKRVKHIKLDFGARKNSELKYCENTCKKQTTCKHLH